MDDSDTQTTADFLAQHGAEIAETIPLDVAEQTLRSLAANYFRHIPDSLSRVDLHGDILANLMRRQSAFERFLIPWINLRRPLADATVVDIGCGTGSSTSAFARAVRQVQGYEIEPSHVAVARDRIHAMGQANASVALVDPTDTIKRLRDDFPGGVDVIALIAVLEHMTEAERADFLPAIWEYLRPGDILVIAELPNRLAYFDEHTAQMPFFHMLSTDIQTRYVNRSPREDFVRSIDEIRGGSREDIETRICRWGIGASFHDFELGLGVDRLETIMLADGYEFEMVNWWPVSTEERLLMDYFVKRPILKPMGFCRSVLNCIFVKPTPQSTDAVTLVHDHAYLAGLAARADLPAGTLPRLLSRGTIGG